MLDIGWQELFIVAVVAIVVIGPRELPRALKAIAQFLRKARAMTREFQDGFDELVRDTELDELKKELSGASPSGLARKFEQTVDPTGEIGDAVREADPTQDVRQALDTGEPEPASEPKIALEPEPAPEPEPEPKPKAKPKPKPRPAAKRKAGGAA